MTNTGFYLLPTNKLYKKENFERLKNFPTGYVGNFYRNLNDKINNVQSNFLSAISADTSVPKDDIQKYLLATSDFAKSMQTDINHYVTRDRINDASFRQKLDPISKNILRRQNPLELVFEDISTFDAENPIVGSLLREIDLKKKHSESYFINSIPSQPGKEFEIKKRLDRLRDVGKGTVVNNNNNNPGGPPPPPDLGAQPPPNLGTIPSVPTLEDLLDGEPPRATTAPSNNNFLSNVWNNLPTLPSFPGLGLEKDVEDVGAKPFILPKIDNSNDTPGNNIFGSIGTSIQRPLEKKNKVSSEIDNLLYKLPDDTQLPHLELDWTVGHIR